MYFSLCIVTPHTIRLIFFFFNDTATTEIYTLSLHDALPICPLFYEVDHSHRVRPGDLVLAGEETKLRSEEHTSELQSRQYLVCRLLLEKKRTKTRSTGFSSRTDLAADAYSAMRQRLAAHERG